MTCIKNGRGFSMINVALPFILGSSYLILLCNLTFGACKLLSDTEYHRIHFF
jgi:hypothetical protein